MDALAICQRSVDDDDDLDFAEDALDRVSKIAMELAVRKLLSDVGRLGAELLLCKIALCSARAAQSAQLQQKVPKLLRDLERVCRWPEPPDPLNSTLRSIVSLGVKANVDHVQKCLLNFTRDPPYLIDQYLRKLQKFSKLVDVVDDHNGNRTKTSKGDGSTAEEYPSHVDADLYAVLSRSHSLCTCFKDSITESKRHLARLKLRGEIVKIDGHVGFDMLFSAWDHWQDLQLRVPVKRKAGKEVKFNDNDSSQGSASRINRATKKMKVVPLESFCSVVKTKLHSRLCFHIQNQELHQLCDGFEMVQNVDSGPSCSLRQVLETRRLSNRMKLVLAYIIARSFWQYYDSPWMKTQWTSDSIHFFPESMLGAEAHSSGALYASKPYFAADFETDGDQSMEYCSLDGVIFRYPRLLTLCVMLLEIGRGQSLRIEDHGSTAANLNETWTLVKRFSVGTKGWGSFDYPRYQEIILDCLGYTSPLDDGLSVETAAFARKAAVHDLVVQSLEKLLNDLGFAEKLHLLGPIDPSQEPAWVPDIPLRPAMPERSHDASLSAQWMDNINSINKYIHGLGTTSVRAPRVAVLDTGVDGETVFFRAPGRGSKIQKWKDWVGNSETHIDENGHGTHTLALVMKVAPHAVVCVARIARDRGGLRNATEAIAQAIDWAANTAKADIITMSFGFQDEVACISRAITQAILDRQGNILFFAAASNSGGNRREMFPASHEFVISIRETNSLGSFSDTNPPVDQNGPAVFGTLGHKVSAAWLSTVDGEVLKSGSSVATAIAAGIAAMILTFVSVGMRDPTIQPRVEVEKVWTTRGMQAVLARMSQNMGNRSYFISPAGFFQGKDSKRAWTAIVEACSG
ncbi:hypothetical protein EsH8_II_001163 [Colletotrichum jinshuiense]